jgi:L-ascorbate metabolism protein UlaG (beta-lactamase superfamily)
MRWARPKLLIALCVLLACAGHAAAQGAAPAPAKPEMRQNNCIGFVAGRSPVFQPVALRLAALERNELRLNYIGHSTFLIETPAGVRIATDYNDYVRPTVIPDIVTMNHAHTTHYTDHPDPRIAHVLRGWIDDEKPARIDITYKDVRVRNVPTNIRRWDAGTERHGNSIFIFEASNLCIAHLGHLHHTLTQAQLDEIGRIDVVLVPVDGGMTLDLDGMMEVLTALKAPLMIPMHYFSSYTLERFLTRARAQWDVEVAPISSLVLSKAMLPAKPKVLVLPGR